MAAAVGSEPGDLPNLRRKSAASCEETNQRGPVSNANDDCRHTAKRDGFWNDDRDQMISQRVSMHVDLCDNRRESICILDLLQSHIFTLRQLEQVLLSVDDLQSSFSVNLADITRVKPAFGVECLFCILLVAEIAFEDVLASEKDLASWVRQVGML